jgi:tRNA A37 threonylcarbamoyladenosine synthetase subunit TsaC/SUA5/YrdC
VAGVLDAGVCDGEVSTVVELTSDGWQLRREGGVRREDVEAVLGPEAAADDH